MNYDDFIDGARKLVGRDVHIAYVSESGETLGAMMKLIGATNTPQNGTVTFDVEPTEVILANGSKGTVKDQNQKWEYKLEFGTTLYQKILDRNFSGVEQNSNRFWVHYTNAFGMRQAPNSLLLKTVTLL